MSRNDRALAEILSAAGRYILEGGRVPKFVGDADQVRVIRNVTIASRRLYETMCYEGSTLDAVATMLDEKRDAAREFERTFKQDWRL